MPQSTQDREYAERLARAQLVWWKRLLNVQAPFRWKLRSLRPGRCLEIGCGIGRNLETLGDAGVGIDHNPHSVAIARERGFEAWSTEEFAGIRPRLRGSFDSLLLSHLVEHLTMTESHRLLDDYLPMLNQGGRIIVITPQEAGYRSDPTHVTFMDFAKIRELVAQVGFDVDRSCSFPLPRACGSWFTYNEFVTVSSRRQC